VFKVVEEIDRIARQVGPRFPCHDVANLVDDMKAGFCVPAAIAIVTGFDDRSNAVHGLVSHIFEFKKGRRMA